MEASKKDTKNLESTDRIRQRVHRITKAKTRPIGGEWSAFTPTIQGRGPMSHKKQDGSFLKEDDLSQKTSNMPRQPGTRSSVSSSSDWSMQGGETDQSTTDSGQESSSRKLSSGSMRKNEIEIFPHEQGAKDQDSQDKSFFGRGTKSQSSGIWRNCFLVDDEENLYDNLPGREGVRQIPIKTISGEPSQTGKGRIRQSLNREEPGLRVSGVYDNESELPPVQPKKRDTSSGVHRLVQSEVSSDHKQHADLQESYENVPVTRPRASSADGLLETDFDGFNDSGLEQGGGAFKRQFSLQPSQAEMRRHDVDGSTMVQAGGGYTRRLSCDPGITYLHGVPVKLRGSPVDRDTRKSRGHSTGSVSPVKVTHVRRPPDDEDFDHMTINNKPRSASTDGILESTATDEKESVNKANRLSWHIMNLAKAKPKPKASKRAEPDVAYSPRTVMSDQDEGSVFESLSSPPMSPPPSYDLITEPDICEPIGPDTIYRMKTQVSSPVPSKPDQNSYMIRQNRSNLTSPEDWSIQSLDHEVRDNRRQHGQDESDITQTSVPVSPPGGSQARLCLSPSQLVYPISSSSISQRKVNVGTEIPAAPRKFNKDSSFNVSHPVSDYGPESLTGNSESGSQIPTHSNTKNASDGETWSASKVEETASSISDKGARSRDIDSFISGSKAPQISTVRTYASPTILVPGQAIYRTCISPPSSGSFSPQSSQILVSPRDSVVSPTHSSIHSPPISSPTISELNERAGSVIMSTQSGERSESKVETPQRPRLDVRYLDLDSEGYQGISMQRGRPRSKSLCPDDFRALKDVFNELWDASSGQSRKNEQRTRSMTPPRTLSFYYRPDNSENLTSTTGQTLTNVTPSIPSASVRSPPPNSEYFRRRSVPSADVRSPSPRSETFRSGLPSADVRSPSPNSEYFRRTGDPSADVRSPSPNSEYFRRAGDPNAHVRSPPSSSEQRLWNVPSANWKSPSSHQERISSANVRSPSPNSENQLRTSAYVRSPPLTEPVLSRSLSSASVRSPSPKPEPLLRTTGYRSPRKETVELLGFREGPASLPVSVDYSREHSSDESPFRFSPPPVGLKPGIPSGHSRRPTSLEMNMKLMNALERQYSFSPTSMSDMSSHSMPSSTFQSSHSHRGWEEFPRSHPRVLSPPPIDNKPRIFSPPPQAKERLYTFSIPKDGRNVNQASTSGNYEYLDEDTSVMSEPAGQTSLASDATYVNWGDIKEQALRSMSPPALDHQREPAIHQPYSVTQLKLAKNRMTDQLLPRPQDFDMGKIMIKKPFPAEHPYSSHMSNFAIFPSFETPEDPKRGYRAREQNPKNDEMPAMPNDVIIINKTKGFGLRREGQACPSEGDKKPLVWLEGEDFDQVHKDPWKQYKQYYPIPPKKYVPNKEQRDESQCIRGNMTISDRAAVATRNVERDQWETSYDRNFTGLGPANPNKLDNLDAKRESLVLTGKEDDVLKKHGVNTFDPPRAFEGRIARDFMQKPAPHTDRWPNPQPNPNYTRKSTLSEKEEHRLLHGTEYKNLPEDPSIFGDQRWKEMGDTFHSDAGLDTINMARGEAEQVPYVPSGFEAVGDDEDKENEIYLLKLRREDAERNQQMEAQNRWKVLEAQTPDHNLTARKHKMDMANNKSQPKVFYDHEGQYQRERSGLYKTSYDPYKLQGQMNGKDLSGPSLMDYSDSHQDALNQMQDINQEMAEILKYSRTLGAPGSVPRLHDQPSQFEAIEPFNDLKRRQKTRLQPNVQASDVRTQEKGIILTDSTHGENFNTPKFLQENVLHPHVRSEPMLLMSSENQDLRNVKRLTATNTARSAKSVQFNDDVMVASGAGAEPLRLASANIENPRSERPHVLDWRPSTTPAFNTAPITTRESMQTEFYNYPAKLDRSRRLDRYQSQFGTNAFDSRKSNITAPNNLRYSWAGETSYKSQHPGHQDLSFKRDDRFNWLPGGGTPRPQTDLLKIQDGFSKTEVRRRFHENFSEQNPDLRENILAGKQHEFAGVNAQILRGTPVTA